MATCPEHPNEEMRLEFGVSATYFCPKCPRHYLACTTCKYTEMCTKLAAHTGPHRDERGTEWE